MVYFFELDERKRKILRAIIDDYVNTAEPVGSRSIAKKHELGFSSATIRNEMADLEEMGYLAQPHTSAGRVPSDKGYRMYVDQLMKQQKLTMIEMDSIQSALELKMQELGQLIKQASQVMSKLTNYTSVAMLPQMNKTTLKTIQLVLVENGRILVVVLTSTGTLRNSFIKVSEHISESVLHNVTKILNEKLSGLTIEQINFPLIKAIEYELGSSKDVLMPVLDGVAQCINLIEGQDVLLEGVKNILNHPEFTNVDRAKEFINTLEEKSIMVKLLSSSKEDEENTISIQIGAENDVDSLKDLSLIKTNYKLGDNTIGTIGIIGPTRMDYARVISTMEYIRKCIDAEIAKIILNLSQ